jgi:hypothetical protein
VRSALLGDVVWFAPEEWPCPPLWQRPAGARVVYRFGEIRAFRCLSAVAARTHHAARFCLLSAWMEAAPSAWVHRWRPPVRAADEEPARVTLTDLYSHACLSRHTGEVLLGWLLRHHVILSWNAGYMTLYRLRRPDLGATSGG